MRTIIFSICLALFSTVAAQENMKMVSGTVTDAATGQPLAGVIVEAYGNHKYTSMTDEQGVYQLKVPEYVNSVSERYIELYEKVTGHKFEKAPDSEDLLKRIENNVLNYLKL